MNWQSLRQREGWSQAATWVIVAVACYFASQYIVMFSLKTLLAMGTPIDVVSATSQLLLRLVIYIVMAGLIGITYWYVVRTVSLRDIAFTRFPRWKDIGLSIVGAVVYAIGSVVALLAAAKVFGVDTSQAQSLGFSQLLGGELLIAFVVLVVLTPLFEEALFRGFLYGRLRQTSLPWWVPAMIVSALFGLAHGQWNVGIDVFVLSMVACGLREVTGSIWAGILLHMAKNMVAFFAVFVFTTGIAG